MDLEIHCWPYGQTLVQWAQKQGIHCVVSKQTECGPIQCVILTMRACSDLLLLADAFDVLFTKAKGKPIVLVGGSGGRFRQR